ncbi:MAG: hypothetical protein CFH10_01324 [Alphaproteobacteria bacterium MarineAlpha4_Bin2]|nr:MAG: hypothetical protein CFH10_01324 [Alphaproteobacteria bacterium MarineAlpha4_Bin2]
MLFIYQIQFFLRFIEILENVNNHLNIQVYNQLLSYLENELSIAMAASI